jgi:hypothetical protein
VGQPVTFTAFLSWTEELFPTGTIAFTIDGLAFPPVAVQWVNGSQIETTFSIATLKAGSHQVIASYNGDDRFRASTSNSIIQTVKELDPPPGPSNAPRVMSLARYGYHMMPTTLVLTFDQALDPTTAQNVKNYRLVGPGGRSIAIRSAVYDAAARTVTLRPVTRLSLQRSYTLTINGTSSTGVRSSAGQLLDGARTGRPGNDHKTAVLGKHLVIPKPSPSTFLAWLRLRRR